MNHKDRLFSEFLLGVYPSFCGRSLGAGGIGGSGSSSSAINGSSSSLGSETDLSFSFITLHG